MAKFVPANLQLIQSFTFIPESPKNKAELKNFKELIEHQMRRKYWQSANIYKKLCSLQK